MFQEDLPALTNPQIQTPTQSRASNLTLTEAACVTFSAITSWESQPIEPCYPVFGRLKKRGSFATCTSDTTDNRCLRKLPPRVLQIPGNKKDLLSVNS